MKVYFNCYYGAHSQPATSAHSRWLARNIAEKYNGGAVLAPGLCAHSPPIGAFSVWTVFFPYFIELMKVQMQRHLSTWSVFMYRTHGSKNRSVAVSIIFMMLSLAQRRSIHYHTAIDRDPNRRMTPHNNVRAGPTRVTALLMR